MMIKISASTQNIYLCSRLFMAILALFYPASQLITNNAVQICFSPSPHHATHWRIIWITVSFNTKFWTYHSSSFLLIYTLYKLSGCMEEYMCFSPFQGNCMMQLHVSNCSCNVISISSRDSLSCLSLCPWHTHVISFVSVWNNNLNNNTHVSSYRCFHVVFSLISITWLKPFQLH